MKGTRLLSVLLLVSTYGTAQNAGSPAEIEQLQVKHEGSEVKIEIMLTGAVQPSVETAINPDRLVLSLPGVISDAKQKRYPLNADGVRGVRMGLNNANPPVTRVVVDLDSALPYTMSADGKSIVLHVQAAETTASRHQGALPAASAPLMDVFRRKPTPPAGDITTAEAPISVPPKLPPIVYTEKPPSAAQPTASASPAKPSAAHPKLGSLQAGTVFPGMGTPGSGVVPHVETSATASKTANPTASNGLGIASVTGGTSAASPAGTGVAPVAAVNVNIAPAAKKEQPVATAAPSPALAPVTAPAAQALAAGKTPAASSASASAAPTVVANATTPASVSVQPPKTNAATASEMPAAPTTSAAGAPNVTSKVLSATVTTPVPPTPVAAGSTTTSPTATVANSTGLPPAPAAPAAQGATVANPPGQAPATAATASQTATATNSLGVPTTTAPAAASQGATMSNPLGAVPASTSANPQEASVASPGPSMTNATPKIQGATVDNPLGVAPGEEPIAQVQLDEKGKIVTAEDSPTPADAGAPVIESTVAESLDLNSIGGATSTQPASKGAAGTTTIAKAIQPDIPGALALRAIHPDFRTAFRIKYVASGSAYLDGGRSAGLSEGMKLVVRETHTNSAVAAADGNDDHIVAELEVTSVAETSAVTDVHTPKRDVTPGDLAYLSSQDEQALVQQSTLSATRKYPTVISFTEGDTLDEEARAEVPTPPMPSVNRARGRLGFDYMGTSFHGAAGGTSMNLGMVARLDMTRIGGTYWNASGYWRGRLNTNNYSGTPTIQDLINRTYHLSMTYDNPDSRLVAGFGRMYLPWAVSLDTIDGGYVGARLGHGSTMGVFAGSTPDPTSWSYNPDRRSGGLFVNFEGGGFDSFRYTSTSGIGLSTIKWKLDRPFVFFENGIYYKRYVAIYDTLQADSPAGNQAVTAPGPGIGRNFLTVRLQPHERIEFDANYNYFRDLPTFDPSLIGTGLLDKYLFQGFSGGVRLEVLKQIWLYTNLGRSNRSGDPASSLNELYGITFGRIPWVKVRADAHYSKFNSSFGSGSYEAVSLSRSLTDSFRLEVLGGKQNFSSTYSSNSSSKFMTSNLEMNMGLHYFFQGGFTVSRGVVQNYDQWLFTMGYRFDTRQKAKNQ
jgi:hypothetical protein